MSKGVNIGVFFETEKFNCMFPHLEETEKFQDQDTGMYSITMCFDKDGEAKDQIESAVEKAKNNDEKVASAKNWYSPIKDGDEMDKEWSSGMWVLKSKTKYQPRIVDRAGESINQGDIRSGSICRAHVVFRAFVAGTNMGVTCFLKDLQLISQGEGSSSAPTFSPLDDDIPF